MIARYLKTLTFAFELLTINCTLPKNHSFTECHSLYQIRRVLKMSHSIVAVSSMGICADARMTIPTSAASV